MLKGDHGSNSSSVYFYFHLISVILTAIVMVGSEIVARFSLTPLPANNPSSTIINTIPFLTLNISLALAIVFNVILTLSGIRLLAVFNLALHWQHYL